jgi:hypothetical protein
LHFVLFNPLLQKEFTWNAFPRHSKNMLSQVLTCESPIRNNTRDAKGKKIMPYYTTVICIDSRGKPCKAEVICGGVSQGFTDADSGKITFPRLSEDTYDVSAKHYGESVRDRVRGGKEIVLRFK